MEQNIIKKGRVDKNAAELNAGNNKKKYKVKAIQDNVVYARKLKLGYYLSGLYYLVLWKSYLEEKNTWEPVSAAQHLKKLISFIYKNHLYKLKAISKAINTALLITKLIIKSITIK